jgi:NADH dehydrogenase FAD-containing subunit
VSIRRASDQDYLLFTVLLHEVATGNLPPLSIAQSTRSLSLRCLDRYVQGKVLSVDLDQRQVVVQKKPYTTLTNALLSH